MSPPTLKECLSLSENKLWREFTNLTLPMWQLDGEDKIYVLLTFILILVFLKRSQWNTKDQRNIQALKVFWNIKSNKSHIRSNESSSMWSRRVCISRKHWLISSILTKVDKQSAGKGTVHIARSLLSLPIKWEQLNYPAVKGAREVSHFALEVDSDSWFARL